jgi:hypothetical protein
MSKHSSLPVPSPTAAASIINSAKGSSTLASQLALKLEARAGIEPSLPSQAQLEKEALEFEERLDHELSTNIEEAREWIFVNTNSYQKLPAVYFLFGQVAIEDWLRLLGEVWTCCDGIGAYRDDLVWIWREWLDQPEAIVPELMTGEELAAFAMLPEQITIYRGCGPENKSGLSWTLNRETAAKFPFMARYRTAQPILLKATINKHRAAALKLERGEEEVIVFDLPSTAWTDESLSIPALRSA